MDLLPAKVGFKVTFHKQVDSYARNAKFIEEFENQALIIHLVNSS